MASTSENYIPVELLQKIFLPQPVKSLLRLRCVCKLWNQVITSTSFIKSHHDHQKITPGNKYLVRERVTWSWSVSFIDSQSNNVVKSHNCTMIQGINRVEEETYYCLNKVYGISKGLVCLSFSRDCDTLHGSIFLWNPLVNKVKKLPGLGIGFEIKHAWRNYMCCFGYHDDDYKVIKVAPFPDMYHVYVYSLRTNCWELHKFDISRDGVDDAVSADEEFYAPRYPNATFVNGVAYFVKEYRYFGNGRIISFDLSSGITREIDFPEDYKNYDRSQSFRLAEYEESIAFIGGFSCFGVNYNGQVLFKDVVMWVLRVEPSDNSFSWDEKYSIKSERKYQFQVKDFINNEKLVIMRSKSFSRQSRKYFLYNVHDDDSKIGNRFRILEDEDEGYWGMLLEENLVLLDETSVPPFVETQLCSGCSANAIQKYI